MPQPTKLFILLAIILLAACNKPANQPPICLHPENPNYFLYKGKPTILVTSGEHYGAVMNAGFNYSKYLGSLKEAGLNYTRIFVGPYSEMGSNNFGISNNTMNPADGQYLTPWVQEKSTRKYDLAKWNPAFFGRLHQVVETADQLGIVAEISLFTSYYVDHQWSISPFNPKNNTLGMDSIPFRQVNTPANGKLMAIQEKYVRKIVQELNRYPNVIFEIQNEPWSDNPQKVESLEVDSLVHPFGWQKIVEIANQASLEWQNRIAQIITDEENKLPNKHLIAQNISNSKCKITHPDPNVSIFNFHYAYPDAASQNLALGKAIALDETGFMPHTDLNYRSEAWKFMLAGGATYNNLDYSFTVGAEDGTHPIDSGTPGWGGVEYRKQIKILKDFIEGFDFIRMKPDNSLLKIQSGKLADFQVLAEKGKQYGIYLQKSSSCEIKLQIPDGEYAVEWTDVCSGAKTRTEKLIPKSNYANLICPEFKEDIALRIYKKP